MNLNNGDSALLRISIVSSNEESVTFTAGKEGETSSVYCIPKKHESEIVLLKQDDKVKRRNE